MGKKKVFIDKKKAVTYSLVYRDASEDADGDDGGQRVLVSVGKLQYPGSNIHPDYYDDEGSVYDSECSLAMSRSATAHLDESYSLSEERRRENLALGFPDDGYDYVQHLRDLGRGRGPVAVGGVAGSRGAVATIPEDQELDGFDDGEDVGAGGEGSDSDDDFTLCDQPEELTAVAAQQSLKLDAATLAAAAAEGAGGAGPSISAGGRGSSAAPSAGPGPGPSSSRAAALTAVRSVMGRSSAARSLATTARSHGSGLGPSVYVHAPRLVPPMPDVKVVDARRLTVQPKGHDDAAAAEALAEVTALSRHTEIRGRRGGLFQDIDEVDKSMAALENGNDPNRGEQVEGDEWADWLDAFVGGGGGGEGVNAGAAAMATAVPHGGGGAADDDEEGEATAGGESEDVEEDEDLGEWEARHRRQRQQQQPGESSEGANGAAGTRTAAPNIGGGGGGAVSVASSIWRRAERRDRKEGFEALDAQFERLAVEYDDGEIGALADGPCDDDADGEADEGEEVGAAGRPCRRRAGEVPVAAGTCELSDFVDVMDEFLVEHRAAEALEVEGLRPMKQLMDDVELQASRPDPEALAVTRERMQRQLEASARAAGDERDEPVRTILVQEAERWDCQSILSRTSNVENHPAKIVEPQRRTGTRGGGLIRLSAKTGMPVLRGVQAVAATRGSVTIPEDVEAEDEQEGGSCSEDDEALQSVAGGSVLDPSMLVRSKDETAEERRARKMAVKEARRNQRAAKKEMKNMFRQQASRAQKQAAGRSAVTGSTYIIP